MMTTMTVQPQRRRTSLPARVSRLTYPVRRGLDDFLGSFLDSFPCNLIGHHWVEVPQSFRRGIRHDREGTALRFHCSRCHRAAGFSN